MTNDICNSLRNYNTQDVPIRGDRKIETTRSIWSCTSSHIQDTLQFLPPPLTPSHKRFHWQSPSSCFNPLNSPLIIKKKEIPVNNFVNATPNVRVVRKRQLFQGIDNSERGNCHQKKKEVSPVCLLVLSLTNHHLTLKLSVMLSCISMLFYAQRGIAAEPPTSHLLFSRWSPYQM